MKKNIFASALMSMLMTCPLMAQSSFDKALTITEGSNLYATSGTVYWKYTSPTDNATLLEMDPLNNSSLTVYLSDRTLPAQTQVVEFYESKYYMLVGPEETVYMTASGGNTAAGGTGFTAHLTVNTNLGLGFTTEYPIVMVDGGQYMISNGTTSTYDDVLSRYFYYEPKETGTLTFGTSNYATVRYVNKAATSLQPVSGKYSTIDHLNHYDIPVNEGEAILILAEVQAGNTCLIQATQAKQGSGDGLKPTTAFVLEEHNTVPAHFGKYWYRYDAKETGYVVVSGQSSMPGGRVNFYGSSTAYVEYSSQQGAFDLRFEVTAGMSYYLTVDKIENSAEETPFEVHFEHEQVGDTYFNPQVIEFDKDGKCVITTPTYSNQEYFYAVDMQNPDDKFELRVRCISPMGDIADWTRLIVYPFGNMMYGSGLLYGGAALTKGSILVTDWSLASGDGRTIPEGRYFISVQKFEYVPLTFLIEKVTVEEGDVLSNPIRLTQTGAYEIPAKDEVFYSYTSNQAGTLVLTLDDPQLEAVFYQDGNVVNAQRNGMEYRLKTAVGQTNAFCIKGGGEGLYTFTFEVRPFGLGESADTPLPIADNIKLGAADTDVWYEYTITQDGVLELGADLTDHGAQVGYIMNYVKGTIHPIETSIISAISESEDLLYRAKLPVKQGDVLTLHVRVTVPQTGLGVQILVRDYEIGESMADPYEMSAEHPLTEFRQASRMMPVYVKVKVKAGSVRILSDLFVGGTLYKDAELQKPVATFSSYQYCYDETGAFLRYYVDFVVSEPEADYYLVLTDGGGQYSALTVVPQSPEAIRSIEADDENAVWFDLMGRRVQLGNHRGVVVRPQMKKMK